MSEIIPMTPGQSPQLLVVDDNEDNRYTLKHRLIREGYSNIVEASNGLEAMDLLISINIDLVLLDALMPEMDGYEVLLQIRNNPDLADIPVIMISAQDEIDNVVRCIEAGADDYFQKPFNAVLLRARVKSSLEKKRLRDETSQRLDILRQVFGKYVPESVVNSIVSGQGKLEPVKTVATILYTDIADFTRIAESMSPEQVVDMLNEYFEAVIACITRYGGSVNQFQGDAMLVTFNVPIADSNHADRAVQAALDIQHIVSTRKFAGVRLATRIGVNSGSVIAGNVGTGERLNYTVHGDAVNLAARLEQLNKQHNSSVLVSGHTVHLLSGSYPIEFIGQASIRGKSAQVKLFRLQSEWKQLKQKCA